MFDLRRGQLKKVMPNYHNITGKYQESAHQDCTLNLILTKNFNLFLIILKILMQTSSARKLENIIQNKHYTKKSRKIYEFYYLTI